MSPVLVFGRNRRSRRKLAILHRVTLDYILLTYYQGSFNRTATRSQIRTFVRKVKDACAIAVALLSHWLKSSLYNSIRFTGAVFIVFRILKQQIFLSFHSLCTIDCRMLIHLLVDYFQPKFFNRSVKICVRLFGVLRTIKLKDFGLQ